MSLQAVSGRRQQSPRGKRAPKTVYNAQERKALESEFSPALAVVLETVADAWGAKVSVSKRDQSD